MSTNFDYNTIYSDEEEDAGISFQEQLVTNMKKTWESATSWGGWLYSGSGKIVYQVSSHAIFLGLPFLITIGMQQIDDMQWQETLKIARTEVEKDTMKQMSAVRPRVARPNA